MSRGNFPVWHDSPEADKLREAAAVIEEVIDWGNEHIDDSGQFDNAASDGASLQNLWQAIILIKAEIDSSPEEDARREEEAQTVQDLRKQLQAVTRERDELLRFMDSTIQGVAMFQDITGVALDRVARKSKSP